MKKTLLLLLISLCLSLCAGCGSSDAELSDELTTEDSEKSYLNGMEDGILYVLHADNTYEPTVFNAATFDRGDVASTPSMKRIMWFKQDFEEIPTFTEGQDKLVLYTKDTVAEEITLERFKDLGVSVGICQMKPHDSGKYSVSTDPDDNNTYPESDADKILDYHNGSIIVDNIQNTKIRSGESLTINEEKDVVYEQTKEISEYGTIMNLEEGAYYDLDIYEGTQKSILKLCADTHIMGSCTVMKKLNYHFTDDYLQEFELPPDIHTGYYTLNALGMFRYISLAEPYTTTTDYNVGIEEENSRDTNNNEEQTNKNTYKEPEPTKVVAPRNKDEIIDTANAQTVIDDSGANSKDGDVAETSYDIEAQESYVRFVVSLTGSEEDIYNATGSIVSPNGVAFPMSRIKTTGALYSDIYVETSGRYKLVLQNASALNPEISVKPIDESEARTGDLE